jgi:ADP-ribose pyrophosphatase
VSGRYMISYDLPPGRFNLRAAAIVPREGHVLIHRSTVDPFWTLPGGRVEWGESTCATVEREIEEELGVTATVGGLAAVVENFFTYAGQRCHELAYYFTVHLPDEFPFQTDGSICHRCRDGSAELEFKWIPITAQALDVHAFVPAILRDRLPALSDVVEHLVFHEEVEGPTG